MAKKYVDAHFQVLTSLDQIAVLMDFSTGLGTAAEEAQLQTALESAQLVDTLNVSFRGIWGGETRARADGGSSSKNSSFFDRNDLHTRAN